MSESEMRENTVSFFSGLLTYILIMTILGGPGGLVVGLSVGVVAMGMSLRTLLENHRRVSESDWFALAGFTGLATAILFGCLGIAMYFTVSGSDPDGPDFIPISRVLIVTLVTGLLGTLPGFIGWLAAKSFRFLFGTDWKTGRELY